MVIDRSVIKIVQSQLNLRHNAGLTVDGLIGQKTYDALKATSWIRRFWSNEKQILGFLQDAANEEGFNAGKVDGIWGPKSEAAYDLLVLSTVAPDLKPKTVWRAGEQGTTAKKMWPRQITSELNEFYGPVGKNQGKVKCPYELTIAWNQNQKVSAFSAHELVVPHMETVFQKTLTHYGIDEIKNLGLDQFGGCLNVRKMRGGNSYSTHSWGIAIDMDPVNNRLRWKAGKAKMSEPVYNFWFDAWEEEGFVSLGRAKNYDWMHVQAARI